MLLNIFNWIGKNWYWVVIITLCFGSIICMIFGSIGDWFEETAPFLFVILGLGVIGGIVCGFIFWEWKWMLVILGGLIGIAIPIIIHVCITQPVDIEEWFVDEFGWVIVIIGLFCGGIIGLIICGFVFWDLVVALCILGMVILIGAIISLVILLKKNKKPVNKQNKRKAKTTNNSNIPRIKLADIAGLDEAKKALEERVILPLKHPEVYAKYGKNLGGGILLFGLPGTGKTMFAQAVASELDAKFFNIKCSDIESKWYGESERNIKKLFENARKEKCAVIFFDEFDSLAKRRTERNEYSTNTVQEILTQMQGAEKNNNMLLVIAATNTPWVIDGALLRPGRFNEKIYIPLPDTKARLFILRKELKKCPMASGIHLEDVAKILKDYSGADVQELCEKIKMKLIKKELEKVDKLEINRNDLKEILSKCKSSILQSDLEKMKEFVNVDYK